MKKSVRKKVSKPVQKKVVGKSAKTAKPQPITPFLWYDGKAEEAMNFYLDIFPNSKKISVSRSGENGPVFSVTFQLNGQTFYALNGGPMYQFTPAVSFFISCETQKEVDHYWGRLTQGGKESRCGWLVDPFGLSWQVVPTALGKYLGDKNPAKAQAVMAAMMKMGKLEIAGLKAAYDSV